MISFVEYVGGLEEVEKIAQRAVNGEADLRQNLLILLFLVLELFQLFNLR